MKEKLLDYLLLGTDVYNRPLRKKSVLLLLCVGAGLVIILGYSVENGFRFFNSIYTVLMTVALVFFTGIFSMITFSWPASDLAAKSGSGSGNMNISVKRLKLGKGFLFALIYTGIATALIQILIKAIFDMKTTANLSLIMAVAASLWAGAMLTRCITCIFEETAAKKGLVYVLVTVWYYIIATQIISFIIRGAYSIIL